MRRVAVNVWGDVGPDLGSTQPTQGSQHTNRSVCNVQAQPGALGPATTAQRRCSPIPSNLTTLASVIPIGLSARLQALSRSQGPAHRSMISNIVYSQLLPACHRRGKSMLGPAGDPGSRRCCHHQVKAGMKPGPRSDPETVTVPVPYLPPSTVPIWNYRGDTTPCGAARPWSHGNTSLPGTTVATITTTAIRGAKSLRAPPAHHQCPCPQPPRCAPHLTTSARPACLDLRARGPPALQALHLTHVRPTCPPTAQAKPPASAAPAATPPRSHAHGKRLTPPTSARPSGPPPAASQCPPNGPRLPAPKPTIPPLTRWPPSNPHS